VGTLRVRRLASEDLDELLRAADLFDEPPDPASARRYLEDERNSFFLAYDGEAIAGFLRGTELLQLKSAERQMFLYEIAVAEGYRRRGAGRALIETLLEWCRVRRFEEVFVFTDPSNTAAVRLYQSTGAVTETPADRMFVYQLGKTPIPGSLLPPKRPGGAGLE
jgi:ribosomal protein S18 acetylase RimI-like enzyme